MNAAHGYLGSGVSPQVRCCQTTWRSPKSNVADCVSEISALLFFSTRIPPEEEIVFGQPRSSIHRTMSSMWMHMSPIMPLPYRIKARHERGWQSLLYGRISAGPVHIS